MEFGLLTPVPYVIGASLLVEVPKKEESDKLCGGGLSSFKFQRQWGIKIS